MLAIITLANAEKYYKENIQLAVNYILKPRDKKK